MIDEKLRRERSLAIHRRMLASQAKRYRNRFTLADGDYRDQYEERQKAEAAMRRALMGG